ncbi:hypothetical protein ACFQZI_00195 [Mucilaginibacter lutimaris]|uniref:Uncharacterized protein n=1 Tax=Mucilaginibacter lutimaris TaxID=931629 RepID=A0ABW2Z952_9SPHI
MLTGLFAYLGDKRKSDTELKNTFRNKLVEITESFYFVTGEKMAIIKKNMGYWANYNTSRSGKSLDFLQQEISKLNGHMEKLDAKNWKSNLVELYFDVSLTSERVITTNLRSKELYLRVLDITEQIAHALPEEQTDLYRLRNDAVTDMLHHYDQVYHDMSVDMGIVKTGLLKQFHL